MDLGQLPSIPAAPMTAASRRFAHRAFQLVSFARPRLPARPAAVLSAAAMAAWLLNSMHWAHADADAGALVAVCAASLVATTGLAAGWAWEPDELERWTVRSFAAALASAAPIILG